MLPGHAQFSPAAAFNNEVFAAEFKRPLRSVAAVALALSLSNRRTAIVGGP
jgi:hypothetical protein